MNRPVVLEHEFLEFIPQSLEEGTLYISMPYATVAHKCCCGCGEEVVTPLSPTDWKLSYDGRAISLNPSIGNWNFACQSHYWIQGSRIRWAGQWSSEEIELGRRNDQLLKKKHFDAESDLNSRQPSNDPNPFGTLWSRFWNRLGGG